MTDEFEKKSTDEKLIAIYKQQKETANSVKDNNMRIRALWGLNTWITLPLLVGSLVFNIYQCNRKSVSNDNRDATPFPDSTVTAPIAPPNPADYKNKPDYQNDSVFYDSLAPL